MIQIILLSLGFSIDAFVVALSMGFQNPHLSKTKIFFIGLLFASIQSILLKLGTVMGDHVSTLLNRYMPYVGASIFILLGLLTLREKPSSDKYIHYSLRWHTLILLAFSTGIDAFGAGLSLSTLTPHTLEVIFVSALITLLAMIFGFTLSKRLSQRFQHFSEELAGVIFILLGLKILSDTL